MKYPGLWLAGAAFSAVGVLVDPGVGTFLSFAGGVFIGVWLVVR